MSEDRTFSKLIVHLSINLSFILSVIKRIMSTRSRQDHSNFSFSSPLKTMKQFPNNINDYDLHEVLGKGGFGTVYRATSKTVQSKGISVALKLINKQQMKEQHLTKRTANEVEIHWQLNHASILQLYNYFEDESYVYLVMELCTRGELFQYLRSRKPLSEDETRGAMKQLVNGLTYLHSNGIIHRDLKMSNLLLTYQWDLVYSI